MQEFEGEQSEKNTEGESTVLIEPRPMRGFVQTPHIKEVAARALNYLRSGFPVHFRGPTGAGKTTLALHVAHRLRRPMVLVHGDDQFTSADLTGKSHGYSRKKVVDEFVRGVSKTEESMQSSWVDHRLTVAVRDGHTLLYDEFNRSRPEANNILLSVLQEGILDFPVSGGKGETYLQVHPNFRVIFTSNPEEYAGVHAAQDALLDRMVTIDLDHYDKETEVKITSSKSNLPFTDSERIVSVVRELRDKSANGFLPTIRGCIMVAKSVKKYKGASVLKDSDMFRKICHDVLISEIARNVDRKNKEALRCFLDELIDKHCPGSLNNEFHVSVPETAKPIPAFSLAIPEETIPEETEFESEMIVKTEDKNDFTPEPTSEHEEPKEEEEQSLAFNNEEPALINDIKLEQKKSSSIFSKLFSEPI
jgi:nitric oxide reductase NorQ protein